MRMERAQRNLIGEFSDDEKEDIYQNKNSETRKLLNIDTAVDKNEFLDVIHQKKKKLTKIVHSRVA